MVKKLLKGGAFLTKCAITGLAAYGATELFAKIKPALCPNVYRHDDFIPDPDDEFDFFEKTDNSGEVPVNGNDENVNGNDEKPEPKTDQSDNFAFMTKEELDNHNYRFVEPYDDPGTDGLYNAILAKDIKLGFDNKKTRRNLNMIVVGHAGAGKTSGVIEPNILLANSNYVINDPTGDLYRKYSKYLESKGYDVSLFDTINTEQSCKYNPLRYIREEADVVNIVESIIENTTEKDDSKDAFWVSSEKLLLSAVMLYIRTLPKEDQNISKIFDLLRESGINIEEGKTALDKRFDELNAKDFDCLAVRQYKTFSLCGENTKKSIFISVYSKLQAFKTEMLKDLLNVDELNIEDFFTKKKALFVRTGISENNTTVVAAMLYTQLLTVLSSNLRKDTDISKHVRFLFDEFQNVGIIPDLANILVKSRKENISCVLVLQTIDQLKEVYQDSNLILSSCNTFILMGPACPNDMLWFTRITSKRPETVTTIPKWARITRGEVLVNITREPVCKSHWINIEEWDQYNEAIACKLNAEEKEES